MGAGGGGDGPVVHRCGESAGHQLLLVRPADGRRGRAHRPPHRDAGVPESQQCAAGGTGAAGAASVQTHDADLRQFPVRNGQLAAPDHRRTGEAARRRPAYHLHRPESGAAAGGVRGAGGGGVLPAGRRSAAGAGGCVRLCQAAGRDTDGGAGRGHRPQYRRLAGGSGALSGGGRRHRRDGRAAVPPVLDAYGRRTADGAAAAEPVRLHHTGHDRPAGAARYVAGGRTGGAVPPDAAGAAGRHAPPLLPPTSCCCASCGSGWQRRTARCGGRYTAGRDSGTGTTA